VATKAAKGKPPPKVTINGVDFKLVELEGTEGMQSITLPEIKPRASALMLVYDKENNSKKGGGKKSKRLHKKSKRLHKKSKRLHKKSKRLHKKSKRSHKKSKRLHKKSKR
jgi:hypothetical protein